MREWADRPRRVPGERWPRHGARMLAWALNLRLVPQRAEWRDGWFGRWRAGRLSDLLTRPGQALVWVAVMIALLGFRNREAFPLLGAGASLGAVAWAVVLGQALRPRLRAHLHLPGPAVAGLAHRAEAELTNTGRWPAYDLAVRALRRPGLRAQPEAERRLCARLAPAAHTRIEFAFVPRGRGLVRFDGIAVQSYFPFHLTRASVRIGMPRELTVLPPTPPFAVPPLRTLAAELAGRGTRQARRHEGVEYRESRPFQRGDSPLRLDQRASARRGALYSRVHQGSERYVPDGIALVVEPSVAGFAPWQRRPRNPEALDRRIGVAAELARRAFAEQLPVRALWLGCGWEHPEDPAALWRALALCGPAHAPSLPATPPPADALCVLIGGAARGPVQAWTGEARAGGRVVAVLHVAEGPGAAAAAAEAGTYEVAW
jgi:uncharacterized protein (DUF58 family)